MEAYLCFSHLHAQIVIYILVSQVLCPYGTNCLRTFITVSLFLLLNLLSIMSTILFNMSHIFVNSPKPAFISISPRADPHPTYLTEETGPILSHSRPWHMDWNPAHSGCWPKVWGCRSCGKCTLTTEEWAQWELVDHMRSTCLGIFLFLGGGAHLQAPPPTQRSGERGAPPPHYLPKHDS